MQKAVFAIFLLCFYFLLCAFSTESAPYTDNYITSQSPRNAPITIVQFSDFQYTSCAKAVPVVKKIQEACPGQVRWIFKNYPLPLHKDTHLAHEAALAAGEQGKFWEIYDLISSNPGELDMDQLITDARLLGLDMEHFKYILERDVYHELVQRDIIQAERLGISDIPTLFIKGTRIDGTPSVVRLKTLIEAEMRQESLCQG